MFCQLVLSSSTTLLHNVQVFQVLLAAAFAKRKVAIVPDADGRFETYPKPLVVVEGGMVLFPSAAVKHLLGEGAQAEDLETLLLDQAYNALVERARADEPDKDQREIVYGAFAKASLARKVCIFAWAKAAGDEARFASFAEQDQVGVATAALPGSLKGRRRVVKEGVEFVYDWSRKRVPVGDQQNMLITSALPYVNNVPHLGNIIGAILSADVYARYCRLRGHNAIYICGTDEYGTATETRALEEGVSCADLCAKYFKLHAAVYEWFGVRFDHFGRTSNAHQTRITHEIFSQLHANGYFLEQEMEQTFCNRCERFLADRYVEGTCPLCGFADARGDQCDGCGKLMNSAELVAPRCKLCGSAPAVKATKHLFLDLTSLQPQVEAFVAEASQNGQWSANSTSIAKGWLTEGLRPRCMTRDLKWGTPVPVPAYADKVFYVWFDAPIGYLSITAEYVSDWRSWWCNPRNVSLYQFMGKDNVPFHTVIFPATLLGTQKPYTLLHHISTTEYLNYETGKFSKSRGVGVFGDGARDSGIPASVWRYYLLAVRPEAMDAVFSWDDFAAKTNHELVANLGNFVNRATKFIYGKMGGVIGAAELVELDRVLIGRVDNEIAAYHQAMGRVHLKSGLKTAIAVSALANQYLAEAKLDAKLLAVDAVRCATVLAVAANLVYLLSALLEPFIPQTCVDMRRILNAPPCMIPECFVVDALGEGHEIGEPFLLFRKLEAEQIEQLRTRFSGVRK